MKSEPQWEHGWLQRLVGTWTYEGACSTGPDQPRAVFAETESVRSLGGLWVVAEGQGQMPDGKPATTMMSLGFGPRTGRYVGTWMGSMMTHLWIYDGWMSEDGTTLTLESEGPSFVGDGSLAKYKDVIKLESDDHRILSSHVPSRDGGWTEFMTAHYHRTT